MYISGWMRELLWLNLCDGIRCVLRTVWKLRLIRRELSVSFKLMTWSFEITALCASFYCSPSSPQADFQILLSLLYYWQDWNSVTWIGFTCFQQNSFGLSCVSAQTICCSSAQGIFRMTCFQRHLINTHSSSSEVCAKKGNVQSNKFLLNGVLVASTQPLGKILNPWSKHFPWH